MNIVKGTEHWDGTTALDFCYDDGGRRAAGYQGPTGDCVTRAIAIATGLPYGEVYRTINTIASLTERIGKRKRSKSNARTGVYKGTQHKYLAAIGWRWHPTMHIGSGCKVHLLKGELPMGRLIVSVSRHLTAVIDGVIHDTHDPTRATLWFDTDGGKRMSHRCVYGYWTKE